MLKVGIVGLPNVGKSTLFKTLTKKSVDCENFPFCTIEPNVGVVEVPDERVDELARVSKSEKVIPTAIEFVDIAGLVRGAHKGEGLGNQFLANIREVDMIVQVVRNFTDSNVTHVEGSVDPKRDLEVIELELAMADLTSVEKHIDLLKGKAKSGMTKDLERDIAFCERVKETLGTGKLANEMELEDDEEMLMKHLNLLTSKPILVVLNVDEADLDHPPSQGGDGGGLVSLGSHESLAISVKVESELVDLSPEEQKEFMSDLGLDDSGLNRLITRCYDLLGLNTYFTSGPKETRAWTVPKGTKAPAAAGVIHTDFEKGFIRAEIINWKDFVELGEAGAREAGKLRTEGKEYVMQDGDTCYFRVA